MKYLEVFIFINIIWGVLTLTMVPLCQVKPFEYRKTAIFLLILSWLYLLACVPLFRGSVTIPDYLSPFYTWLVIILSIEVWIVMLLTLLAIGLAKKSHDPEHSSYMILFHKPLVKLTKPLWLFIGALNVINAGYYFVGH